MMATVENSVESFNLAQINQQAINEAASRFFQNFNAWNTQNNYIPNANIDIHQNFYKTNQANLQNINLQTISNENIFFDNLQNQPQNTMIIGNPHDLKDSTEYELIIYQQMLETEVQIPAPRVIQTEITAKTRGMLVDWLCRVHYKCRLSTSIFYRCIGIIDRLLMLTVIHPNELKLIGCTAMLIASKIEGQHFYINHAIELSENSFNREMMINTETKINNLLGFQLNFPTSFMFLSHLQRLSEERSEIVLHSRYIIEVCSSAIEFINVKPSAIACSAIFLTRILHNFKEESWTKRMEEYTGYSYEDLIGYVKIIHSILLDKDREESTFMRRKYGSVAFHCVANFPLPCFII